MSPGQFDAPVQPYFCSAELCPVRSGGMGMLHTCACKCASTLFKWPCFDAARQAKRRKSTQAVEAGS